MKASGRDWFLVAALGVIWGGSFMCTKLATSEVPPLSLAATRLSLGAAALLAILPLSGERLPGRDTPGMGRFWAFALAVALVSNAIPFMLLAWAQKHIDSSLAGVFMAMVPLFILPLAHLFVPGERLTPRKTLGFLLGFAGVVVLIGPGALAGLGSGGTLALLAQLACLGVALHYASGSIITKRAPNHGVLPFATASLLLAALVAALAAYGIERPSPGVWSLPVWGALLYLGLLPTALATWMLMAVVASAGPSFLGLVNYQVPVWAVIFGAVFLGEEPSPSLWLALLLILGGLAVARGAPLARRGGHAKG